MKKIKRLPEQVKRLSVLLIILMVVFIWVQSNLVPDDFGKLGHYRTSALTEMAKKEVSYAGEEVCMGCHDGVAEIKEGGNHKNLNCEVCHGPSAQHANNPFEYTPKAPRKRELCPACHEYLPSRPTGFPQIISASHNHLKACITCHDPHEPVPPETPKECAACHGKIANTKKVSHHANVKCTTCHQTPEQHKMNPRENLPSKPEKREFCGQCHSDKADAAKGIPGIDLETHKRKYVCWQCHYPHLPEVK